MRQINIVADMKRSARSLLKRLERPTEYQVTWEGEEKVSTFLNNKDAPQLINCLPICADKMRRIINVYPSKSLPLHYAKYYDKVVYFDKGEYLSAYATDAGYGYLKEKIAKDASQRSARDYSFDKLICVDDKGHIEKEVIPAFAVLTAYPTNMLNTYYVDYRYAKKITAFSEFNKAALVSGEFLLNACVVSPTILWTTNLMISGPSVNISWGLTGTKDPLFSGWFKQTLLQLFAIFKFGFPEAVRAFAPGIQSTIEDFQRVQPYIDNDAGIYAVESLSDFLTEVYQSIYDIGGFPSADTYKKPVDFVLEELRLRLNDDSIVVRDTTNISKAYKDFIENLEIRKDLLKEFNKIQTH